MHLAPSTDATVALQELTITTGPITEEFDSAVITAPLVQAQQSPMHNSINGENPDSVQALASRHPATSTQAVSLPNAYDTTAHDSYGTSQPLHCTCTAVVDNILSVMAWPGQRAEYTFHAITLLE